MLSAAVLGGAFSIDGCAPDDAPSSPEKSVGHFEAPELLIATPGDRADGQLRGNFQIVLDRALAAETWIKIDQGYVEDGLEIFGTTVRYRLPNLPSDLLGHPLAIRVQRIESGGAPTRCRLRVLRPEEGWFAVFLEKAVVAGTRLEFQLGGEDFDGPRTATVPLELELHAFVLFEGKSERLDGCVPVRVVDPQIDWLRVLSPPTLRPGEEATYTLCFMNGDSGPRSSSMVAPIPAGLQVEWRRDARWTHEGLSVAIPEEDRSLPQAVRVQGPALPPGIHRISFRVRSDGFHGQGISAPIEVSDDASRLRFGSLHNHTAVGGHGASTPRRTFRYAEEISGLDFCGLCEHAESPLLDWNRLCRLETPSSNRKFVTYLGFEWTHALDGHRHVVYRHAAQRIPYSSNRHQVPEGVGLATSLEELAQVVGHDPDALVAVHHPLWFGNVAQQTYRYGAPELMPRQRLAEVYSWHGSSLGGVDPFPIHDFKAHLRSAGGIRSALAQGHSFQLIADSDNHLGRPGSLVGVEWPRARRYAYQGLVAVRCNTLDRSLLFDALEAPSTYGTTGARLQIRCRRDEAQLLELEVHATAPLQSILLHSPEKVLHSIDFDAVDPEEGSPTAPRYLDPSRGVWDYRSQQPLPQDHEGALWIEVVQQDHHRAWHLIPHAVPPR